MIIDPKPISSPEYDIADKLMIHGASGDGKTHLLATIGSAGLIIDVEKGLKTLQKVKGKALRKNIKRIQGQRANTHSDVMDIINWVKGRQPDYDWLALDSISDLAFQSLQAWKKQVNDPRLAYQHMESEMSEILRELRDLTGYKVIVLAGTSRIEDEDTRRTMYVPSMPSKNTSRSLQHWFDEVLCATCERENVKDDIVKRYYVQCQATPNKFAKDRSGELEVYEEPDLSAIFEKILN